MNKVATKPVTTPANSLGNEDRVKALRLPRTGKLYDLDCSRWPGMPLGPGHPPFQVLNYRTPRGIRNIGDQEWLAPNDVNFAWHSEYVLGTAHTGTHIDALGHITCGHDDLFHGGGSSNRELGDFGLLAGDATELPAIINRGVLIDVPATQGVPYLKASQQIARADVEAALMRQKTDLRKGDTVLIRTGYLSGWPDVEALARTRSAGINLEAAEFLLEQGAVIVGGDTETLECLPSGIKGDPMPVHRRLLVESGIYIMEMVYVEELSRDSVYEFLFVCLPLKIKGATGSMARPVAII